MSDAVGTTKLQIESWSNAARKIRVTGFFQGLSFSFEHVTNADRSRAESVFLLSRGKHRIPDSLVLDVDSPVRRGELYVRATIQWTNLIVKRLSTGYLTDGQGVSWPPGIYEGFTSGPGLIRVITGVDPAAGAEVSETVPDNARWRLRSIRVLLTTDATVANRGVRIILDDGTDSLYLVPDLVAQTATKAWTYTAAIHAESRIGTVQTGNISLILPDLILFQGYRVRTHTQGIVAGDDYGTPILEVEEWIEE